MVKRKTSIKEIKIKHEKALAFIIVLFIIGLYFSYHASKGIYNEYRLIQFGIETKGIAYNLEFGTAEHDEYYDDAYRFSYKFDLPNGKTITSIESITGEVALELNDLSDNTEVQFSDEQKIKNSSVPLKVIYLAKNPEINMTKISMKNNLISLFKEKGLIPLLISVTTIAFCLYLLIQDRKDYKSNLKIITLNQLNENQNMTQFPMDWIKFSFISLIGVPAFLSFSFTIPYFLLSLVGNLNIYIVFVLYLIITIAYIWGVHVWAVTKFYQYLNDIKPDYLISTLLILIPTITLYITYFEFELALSGASLLDMPSPFLLITIPLIFSSLSLVGRSLAHPFSNE